MKDGNVSVTSIRGTDLSVFQGYLSRESGQSVLQKGSRVSKFECIEEKRENWSYGLFKAFMIKMQFSSEGEMDEWPKWSRQLHR